MKSFPNVMSVFVSFLDYQLVYWKAFYNNIHHPSKLATGADFHCFKYQIEPKWEDPLCANGGKWTATFPKGKSDTAWLYTLLAMIGEQFDNGDEICGAVVNVRARQEKIALWTKNAVNEAAQLSIGRQWKEFLDYKDTIGSYFMRMQRSSTEVPRTNTQHDSTLLKFKLMQDISYAERSYNPQLGFRSPGFY